MRLQRDTCRSRRSIRRSWKESHHRLPTFEYLGAVAQIGGAEVITVPLSKNYAHDLNAMLARTDAATGLIYICNPNNPTASITPRRDIEDFLQKLPRTA